MIRCMLIMSFNVIDIGTSTSHYYQAKPHLPLFPQYCDENFRYCCFYPPQSRLMLLLMVITCKLPYKIWSQTSPGATQKQKLHDATFVYLHSITACVTDRSTKHSCWHPAEHNNCRKFIIQLYYKCVITLIR